MKHVFLFVMFIAVWGCMASSTWWVLVEFGSIAAVVWGLFGAGIPAMVGIALVMGLVYLFGIDLEEVF